MLAGEGPSFCAGADVEWQRSSIDLSYDENVEDAMRLFRMLEAIDTCPAPVVCLVQGYALGGGSGLVACADIAVARPDAVFGFTEVRLGIIPAVISPFVLPKIGSAARRYFLTGERFGAEVALRIGLVHEVSEDPDEALVDHRRGVARRRTGRRARSEATRPGATRRDRDGAGRSEAPDERRGSSGVTGLPRQEPPTLARPVVDYSSQEKTTDAAERSTGPWYTASTLLPSGSRTNAA